MKALVDVGINLVAAFCGIIIGRMWGYGKRAMQYRKARRFWRPFINRKFNVIMGVQKAFYSWEPSGFVGIGDALALKELQSYFDSAGLGEVRVLYDRQVQGDSLRSDLVSIGGPDANEITRRILDRTPATLRCGNPDMHEVAIHDLREHRVYAPRQISRDGEPKILSDYAFILKTRNPFNPDREVLVVAGSFGYGSWAGIRLLIDPLFLKLPLVSSGRSFECLVETDVELDTPQNTRAIILREISSASQDESSSP
jgi:hypothetical protein